jgi:hypothetical protein
MRAQLRRLERPAVVSPDRGRLLDAREVAAIVFRAQVSGRWVLEHVAPMRRIWWGRECYWYEADARDWCREWQLANVHRVRWGA